jgi:predicted TIM-barrel fold metal-dependent hydrolase
MILDSHLHLVDRSRLSYPWLANFPTLDRDWTFADYWTSAARLGITEVLHMEVDVADRDIDLETDIIRGLMARPGSPLRGAISAARPETQGFAAWLEAVDRTIIKGLRRVLHVVPDDLSRQGLFRENLRRLGPAGLPFDICVLQRQLPIAIELVDACPDTVFILDHCGVPDIAGEGLASSSKDMARLAQRPNISVKVSGITAYARPDWSLDTLKPYVETVIALFGWDRVVWGSDSPVCTLHSSLDQWVGTTHALLAGASADEREKLLRGNARRIWNIAAR